jgi:V8-like Glu-specific endopeptidase
VFSHDASTLGGNSGSAVVDLGSNGGSVIGLHFGGMSREQNWAHAVAKIQEALKPLNLTWI